MTLPLQLGWNNLDVAVSASTTCSSLLLYFHAESLAGEYTTLTTLDTASYPGSYPLRSSPLRYQPEPPFSLSSPSFYTTPTVTQVAIGLIYSLNICSSAGSGWLKTVSKFNLTARPLRHPMGSLRYLSLLAGNWSSLDSFRQRSFSFQHSQHPTLSTESIAESSYKTLTGSRGILGDFNHYVPSVAASPGFSLHHSEPSVPDQTTLPRFCEHNYFASKALTC